VALNFFISGKILTPDRNICNPTLLERSMKNKFRTLEKIVRRELNESALQSNLANLRRVESNCRGICPNCQLPRPIFQPVWPACQLICSTVAGNIGIVTDLGHMTKLAIERVRSATVLVLEGYAP
jgi:hypothetical protein